MFTPSSSPYVERLDSTLILKSLSTHDEIEPLAEFNGLIHGAPVANMVRALILHHPDTRPEHWLMVNDEATGAIVSSLCLLPWTWRYEDVTLKVGEMGIVGTLESYRHRGLIRAQDRRFKALLAEGEFDISPIQGIPYFYRQLGYEYCLPLEGGWHLRLDQIPGDIQHGYTFRPATLDDLPPLMRFYDDAACDLDISAARSEAIWRFLIEHEPVTGTASETWLVLDPSGTVAGYWRMERFGFGEGLTVTDTSRLHHRAAAAVLGQVKTLAQQRGKPYVRVACADLFCPLIPLARAWGAQDTGRYAWQIHLPDVPRLLRKIAPVLERRVAASPFAGLTHTLCLNLYREAFELLFECGKLKSVDSVGFRERGDVTLPPLLLAPLVLGYRSRAELRSIYPDVGIWGEAQALIDVIFPKMESFLYTIY